MEEHISGMLTTDRHVLRGASANGQASADSNGAASGPAHPQPPDDAGSGCVEPGCQATVRGIVALGADTPLELKNKLDALYQRVEQG